MLSTALRNSGLDLLLRRIAEGVRPPTQKAAVSKLPSSEISSTSTRRGEQDNAGGEDGNSNNTTRLPGVDPPYTFRAENGEGMNNRAGKGCGSIEGASRNVRSNKALCATGVAAAGNHGSKTGPTPPSVIFGGEAKETARKGPTSSSDKENQPRISKRYAPNLS